MEHLKEDVASNWLEGRITKVGHVPPKKDPPAEMVGTKPSKPDLTVLQWGQTSTDDIPHLIMPAAQHEKWSKNSETSDAYEKLMSTLEDTVYLTSPEDYDKIKMRKLSMKLGGDPPKEDEASPTKAQRTGETPIAEIDQAKIFKDPLGETEIASAQISGLGRSNNVVLSIRANLHLHQHAFNTKSLAHGGGEIKTEKKQRQRQRQQRKK